MTAEEYLAGQRVNIEVILWINDKNILHFGVRLRPWKQETRIGAMVLAQGLSLPDAIKNAARDLYNGKWERLDYSARPWAPRNAEPDSVTPPADMDFLAPEVDAKPHLLRGPIETTAAPKKTS